MFWPWCCVVCDFADEREVQPYRRPYVDQVGENPTAMDMFKVVVKQGQRPRFPSFNKSPQREVSWELKLTINALLSLNSAKGQQFPWRQVIARNASHFTAKRASSAFVTIERLSTKNRQPRADRPLRWSAPTGSELKLKDLWGRVLVGRFFPLFLLALASCGRFASVDHLTVYFLVCRSLRVWMAGMFANLTIFLSYYY